MSSEEIRIPDTPEEIGAVPVLPHDLDVLVGVAEQWLASVARKKRRLSMFERKLIQEVETLVRWWRHHPSKRSG